jgi:hypothetical protein
MTAMMLLGLGVAACSSVGNGGATGAAPERYMGVRPNVNGTWNGTTSSSSMLKQRIKQDFANGATSGGANTQY